MKKQIELNGQVIEYDLQIKDVKNINLRIKSDQGIFVSANQSISNDIIEEFLISKADYIVHALNRYAEMAKYIPSPKQYVNGETFRILGHDRRLRVIQGKKNQVESDESYLELTVSQINDIDLKKRTVDAWIKDQFKQIVTSICSTVYPRFQKYGVTYPEIRLRNMVSRWGSCQPKRGILTFNIALIEVPLSCIEYVVVHEYTHFLQPNHSRKFYELLPTFMPDWMERKKLLEKSNYYIE